MQRFQIDIPDEAISEVAKRYYVKELALFGSVLRDDFRPDSDVDILVEFEPNAPIGFVEYLSLAEELSNILGRQVDLVSKVGLKRRIRRPVLDSAKVIYAR